MSTPFKAFLMLFLLVLLVYTGVVVAQHGPNLVVVFFGDMAAVDWRGQFNLDFMGFLILSLTWVMWRHEFSLPGILLGCVAGVGGMVFLSIYLLVISRQANGDMREVLLGRVRAMR